LIAEEAGWIEGGAGDSLLPPMIGGGLVCLALGILQRVFSPVRQKLRKSRCVRCGAAIERGQTYCLDHLRDTVNKCQDHAREIPVHRHEEMV
jgi:hypothetical protein